MNRQSVTASGQRWDIYYPAWYTYRERASCALSRQSSTGRESSGDLCHAPNVLSQRWSLLRSVPSQGSELPPKQIHTCAL